MPELPEVESLRIGLVKKILNQKILSAEVLHEKLIAGKGTTRKANKSKTKAFIIGVERESILNIKRRAKNLIFQLTNGKFLMIHLKMTGQLVYVPNDKKEKISFGGHPIEETGRLSLPHKHTYIIFSLEKGTLYYNDVRQFGYVLYYENKTEMENQHAFSDIGLEPFDKRFTLKYFAQEVFKLKKPIKKIFLDQDVVVGCGNIYADEVCFASGVLPQRYGNSLNKEEINNLYKNILKILDLAIKSGGSSVANYLLADGKRGNYTDFHKVYKREDKQCLRGGCDGIISKENFAGRGTHFCRVCQK